MEIRIITLKLENFKCHGNLELAFDGEGAVIYGDNGAGKTSVYDAFVWLLYGKDSKGNGEKLAEVKPLNGAGAVRDPDGITAVEAVLDVDGEKLRLRREYHELWRASDGGRCYEGNSSSYFLNGIGVRYTAFRNRVDALLDEAHFRMLTDVGYFAFGLPWQKRREILAQVAGIPEDRQVLLSQERFAPLLEAMGKLSLNEYRERLLAQKKGYLGARNELPARMDECRKLVGELEALDFEEVQVQRDAAAARKEELGRELAAVENDLTPDAALQAARMELAALDARSRERAVLARRVEELDRRVQEAQARLDELREVDTVCPTCGQALPEERLKQARDAYSRRREARNAQLLERRQEAAEARAELEAMAPVGQRGALEEKVRRLTEVSERLRMDARGEAAKLRQRLAAAERQLADAMAVLAKEATLDYARERMETLRREAEETAQKLAQVEQMLDLIDEFTRYRVSFVEDSVNRKFRIANFRLFREQANGGLEERCDVTYHGVPYLGLNSGARINVGIDIRNTLSRAFGIRVPLFIDNAEAVTRLERAEGQVIRLVVSAADKVIRKEDL